MPIENLVWISWSKFCQEIVENFASFIQRDQPSARIRSKAALWASSVRCWCHCLAKLSISLFKWAQRSSWCRGTWVSWSPWICCHFHLQGDWDRAWWITFNVVLRGKVWSSFYALAIAPKPNLLHQNWVIFAVQVYHSDHAENTAKLIPISTLVSGHQK